MQKIKIWFISNQHKFPLSIIDKGSFDMELIECSVSKLKEIYPNKKTSHLFYAHTEISDTEEIISALIKANNLDNLLRVIVVPEEKYEKVIEKYGDLKYTYFISDSIRHHTLRQFLELLIHSETNRQLIHQLSIDLQGHIEIFDNFFELVRKEMLDSAGESTAFKALLKFEEKHRKFSKKVDIALEVVNKMRDQELLGLQDQVTALERLDEYQKREFQEVKSIVDASEAVLEFSRKENLERESVIDAMDRLQNYTEKEIIELIDENKDLRKKLKMPPKSSKKK